MADPEQKQSSFQFWGMLIAGLISGVAFFCVHYFWLRFMPSATVGEVLWKCFALFLWIIITSVFCHKLVAWCSTYEYHIFNAKDGTMQLLSAIIYTIYIISGIYGWLIALALPIPTGFSFEDYPWMGLLFTYVVLKLVVFCIAFPIAMKAAKKTDERVEGWAHTVGYGSYGSKERKRAERERKRYEKEHRARVREQVKGAKKP